MLLKTTKYFFGFLFLILCSCSNSIEKAIADFSDLKTDSTIKYAKRFSIASNKDFTLVYLFGNKLNFDTTATYLIYKDSTQFTKTPKNTILVKSSCKNIAALSSIYANIFCELGLIGDLTAIDNSDYINNTEIISKYNSNQIKELAKGIEINLEQTIKLKPDIIFTFGMGDPKKDINPKLLLTKIPVAISLDHLEETPLARAEWIQFFAAFVNKKEMADSIFKTVEQNYNALKLIAVNSEKKPTVFSEIKFSD